MLRTKKIAEKSACLRFSLAFAIGLLCSHTTLGQITGNPNVVDPMALPITTDLQRMLCGKEWHCLNIIETRRGVREDRTQSHLPVVEFGCNGDFAGPGISDREAKWKIVNSQFLEIRSAVPPRRTSQPLLWGAYSVYAISDSTLVLGRILTSSGDWTKEYVFSTKPPKSKPTTKILTVQNPPDSIKPGKKVRYYNNGKISSLENYGIMRRKVSAEEIFLNKGRFPRHPFQDSIQLVTVRTGEWISYFPDGQIQSRTNYDSAGHLTGRWVKYFPDGRLSDTGVYSHNKVPGLNDHYLYKKGETWPLIERTLFWNMVTYVIGHQDSVQFKQIEFYESGRVGSYLEKKIPIKNLSPRRITITTVDNPPVDMRSTTATINPGDSAELVVKFKIPSGSVNTGFQLRSGEWVHGFNLHTFGYHLTNSDFDSTTKKRLPSTFVYHRVSDDYELLIRGVKSAKAKYVPVSKQMNSFDLKKGQYEFTLIGPAGRKTIEVEIQ
jgi:hypothetical protein